MNTIGKRIRHYREMNNLTQEDVAKHLNTSAQNIYKYEKDIVTNIPIPNIIAMAELFGIKPGDLAGFDSPPDPYTEDMARQARYASSLQLSEIEKEVIIRYRENENLQEIIHKILDISTPPSQHTQSNVIVYGRMDEDSFPRSRLRVASSEYTPYRVIPRKEEKEEEKEEE